jgi:hypothetical protein
LLSIRETGIPTTSSYFVFDEYTTGLDFDDTTTSFIRLPIAVSGRSPTTLQFNCTVAKNQTMTLLTGDDKWALNVARHPTISTLGRFEILSGSSNTQLVTSSYYDIFGDELLNVAIQTYNNTSSFYFRQVDGEDIIFSQIVNESIKFPSLWQTTNYVFVGGAGLRVTARYDGTIDEVRLWNTSLSDEVILNTAYDPGSNAGDTYTDAANHLLVQLSFNSINSASLAANTIQNESPYKNITDTPSLTELFCSNINEASFTRYNRIVKQVNIPVGTSAKITNKIIVESAPTFISDGTGLRLYRNKSIVPPQKKKLNRGRNKVILAVSPTDIVNQNIIRNLGLENINAVLGAPTTLYTTFDKSLAKIKNHYQQYYYVDVNTNKFIRILSDLASVLNQVVDYFIPSKATLVKGIIIEPNILEQVKVSPLKNIRVYGKDTRKTLGAAAGLSGSTPDYGATFNLTYTLTQPQPETLGAYSTVTSQSNVVEPTTVGGTYNNVTGSINIANLSDIISNYTTYDLKNITWQEYRQISNSFVSSSRNVWPKQKIDIGLTTPGIVSGVYTTITSSVNIVNLQDISSTYSTYDLKNITWQEYRQISNSFVSESSRLWPKQRTEMVQNITGSCLLLSSSTLVVDAEHLPINTSYITYDLNHISWYEYRQISNSFVSGTVENISGSAPLWKKQRIDVGLSNSNKITYTDINYGKEGAEPYNRIYTRKLFKEEISSDRLGGNTSLYTPALNDIPPTADFRDFGVYTYFNNSEGIYYFNEIKKIPTYFSTLNATWDFNNQTFGNTITTWSYGSKFNKNDVVYQQVTANNLGAFTSTDSLTREDVIKFSKGGNGYYYVFKNRPAYNTEEDAQYSGSIPTYVPPSLDKANWDVLRFKPVQTRVAKRVVFDTYIIAEPSLNNFKTTTISVDKIINIPDRYIDRFSLGTVPASSYITGELSVQNIAVLFAIQSNIGGLRLRLYRTQATRDADINRSSETLPVGSHGVLLDTTLTGVDVLEIANPIHTLVAGEVPPDAKLFYTVNNADNITKPDVTIQLYYFALEIEPRTPLGYLPKHYKFFRDNSTATKRRNFVGCKNTVETTIDGLPPIQIFIGEGTDIQVTVPIGNEEIVTGGGGTLNVT